MQLKHKDRVSPAPRVMDILSYTEEKTPGNKNLFVFLRGIGRSHRSFKREGFVEKVRALQLPFDMVAPNSHFGYYSDRSIVSRLRQDVIIPAQQQGYEQIWLVGLSMGGLGALFYLREYPEDIKGVYLISPFLGNKAIVKSVTSGGGVKDWHPGEYDAEEDWQRMLWDWIRNEVATEKTPPVYMGAGEEDDYVKGQRLLSAVLPEGAAIWVRGGHHYPTFVQLWSDFLTNVLPKTGTTS